MAVLANQLAHILTAAHLVNVRDRVLEHKNSAQRSATVVDVDRDNWYLKTGVWPPQRMSIRTMSGSQGGSLIKYFNRFGRQWKVPRGERGEYRAKI